MKRKLVITYLKGMLVLLSVLYIQTLYLSPVFADNKQPQTSHKKVFQAGASMTNITPPLNSKWYDGRPVVTVHDDLHARCLVLDDGKTQLAFIVVDIIALNRELIDEAKKVISEETDLLPENIMVSATHTHSMVRASTPPPFNDYQKFVIRRISDAARIAIFNLEPAIIGWGEGSVPQHVFVRRWFMKPEFSIPNPYGGEDKVLMNPGRQNPNLVKPAGVPDTSVQLLSVKSVNGKPISILANYGLHYVGGVPGGHISADYFGVFGDKIQELIGADRQFPPFVGIMSNGSSGDVNNIDYSKPAEKHSHYAKMRIVANDVANEALKVYNNVKYKDWVSLESAQKDLALKIRKPDSVAVKYANEILKGPDREVGPHKSIKRYNESFLSRLKMPDTVDVLIQAFRIGDLAITAIPFEVFAETGLEIKEKSRFDNTIVISHANGHEGYLPTPRQHEWGGYESWTNRYQYDASVKITDTLMEMLDKFEN